MTTQHRDATQAFLDALTNAGMKTKVFGRDRWRAQCPAHHRQILGEVTL